MSIRSAVLVPTQGLGLAWQGGQKSSMAGVRFRARRQTPRRGRRPGSVRKQRSPGWSQDAEGGCGEPGSADGVRTSLGHGAAGGGAVIRDGMDIQFRGGAAVAGAQEAQACGAALAGRGSASRRAPCAAGTRGGCALGPGWGISPRCGKPRPVRGYSPLMSCSFSAQCWAWGSWQVRAGGGWSPRACRPRRRRSAKPASCCGAQRLLRWETVFRPLGAGAAALRPAGPGAAVPGAAAWVAAADPVLRVHVGWLTHSARRLCSRGSLRWDWLLHAASRMEPG